MDVWNQDASQLTFQEWRSLLSKALGRAQRFKCAEKASAPLDQLVRLCMGASNRWSGRGALW